MKHEFYDEKDFTTEELFDGKNQLVQNVVNGGLAVCKVCGQYEGSLMSECVGKSTSALFGDFAYAKLIDVLGGKINLVGGLYEEYLKQTSEGYTPPTEQTPIFLNFKVKGTEYEIELLERVALIKEIKELGLEVVKFETTPENI